MESIKVSGIVVREAPMGEKDKRVVLLTREQGKVSVIAKGALSPKSRFAALTSLFCCGRFELTKGKTFYYISDAELLESYYELRTDLDVLSVASAIVDVAAEICLDGQENNALINLTLRALNALKNSGRAFAVGSLFFWRVMCENGYQPNMEACPLCGGDLTQGGDRDTYGFRMVDGTFICPTCQKTNKASAHLSYQAFITLKQASELPQEQVFKLSFVPEEERAILQITSQYLIIETGRDYRSIHFLI